MARTKRRNNALLLYPCASRSLIARSWSTITRPCQLFRRIKLLFVASKRGANVLNRQPQVRHERIADRCRRWTLQARYTSARRAARLRPKRGACMVLLLFSVDCGCCWCCAGAGAGVGAGAGAGPGNAHIPLALPMPTLALPLALLLLLFDSFLFIKRILWRPKRQWVNA